MFLKAARLRRFELSMQGRLSRGANVCRENGGNRVPLRLVIETPDLKNHPLHLQRPLRGSSAQHTTGRRFLKGVRGTTLKIATR
jgi:hypothetical protein